VSHITFRSWEGVLFPFTTPSPSSDQPIQQSRGHIAAIKPNRACKLCNTVPIAYHSRPQTATGFLSGATKFVSGRDGVSVGLLDKYGKASLDQATVFKRFALLILQQNIMELIIIKQIGIYLV